MTLPPALDWIGWLAFGMVVVAFALAFVKQRMKKKADRLKPKPPVCRLPLFPEVCGTLDFSQEQINLLAKKLRETYFLLWEEVGTIYGIPNPHPISVSTILLSPDLIEDEHPHIVWRAPRGVLEARVQPGLVRWFALELHNVFRCSQFGVNHIYVPRDHVDSDSIIRTQNWIEEKWG